jgi:hypothetical protein
MAVEKTLRFTPYQTAHIDPPQFIGAPGIVVKEK